MKKYTVQHYCGNLLDQCDPDGFYTNVMEVLLEDKCDVIAVPMSEKYFITKQIINKMRQ